MEETMAIPLKREFNKRNPTKLFYDFTHQIGDFDYFV